MQHYVEQMYVTYVFEEKEFTTWEAKAEAEKMWENATTHFGTIYRGCRTFNKGMK